ncbi:MAG: undecaprenyl diphosphate synthase [Erysipelotrichaceae bacterium]|nr:MAG: undecaprenyl diphosphate synthase [Erysipelotrichaceae bacterium]
MTEKLKHVAIIMDGNGRWAKKQDKERTFGHFHGVEKVREIAITANDENIEVLTLYAFSTENWKRPIQEVDYLMQLPSMFFSKYLKELLEKNIRIESIGDLTPFPENTKRVLLNAIKDTSHNTGMVLVFAMNYGSRTEIVEAAKKYHLAMVSGKMTEELNETNFEQFLMTKDYPAVDLCIRTSGEQRLSNFLMWQLAYAELIFTDTAWPELSVTEFKQLLDLGLKRERRFGGLI